MKITFHKDFLALPAFEKFQLALLVLALSTHLLNHIGLITIPKAFATDCAEIEGSKVITVKMEGDKFFPDTIAARVCDTIQFTNTGLNMYEPAIGPHPTHKSYPGFDAGRPILPGETFEFVLNRTGSYSFHDHLNTDMIGNITITK